MTLIKVILGLVLIPVSFVLAILSEGIALQCGSYYTPGLYIVTWFISREASEEGLLGKWLEIAVSIDASVWFLLICGMVLLIRRHNRTEKSMASEPGNQPRTGGEK